MVYKSERVKNVFLKLMEANDVKYVLLSEFLGGRGGDIDIYLPDDSLINFNKFAKNYLLKQKYVSKYLNHHFYFFNYSQYRPLRVHIKFDLSFYDEDENVYRLYDDESNVIENSVRSEYGYRPYGYHAILLYAAKCGFLEKKELQIEQLENLTEYINLFSDEIDSISKKRIVENIKRTIQDFGENSSFKLLSANLRRILRPLFKEKKQPDKYSSKSKKKGIPRFTVLFIGPDGAGKSTLIQSVTNDLEIPVTVMYGGLGKDGFIMKSLFSIRERAKNIKVDRIKWLFNKLWWLLFFPIELLIRQLIVYRKGENRLLVIDRFPTTSYKDNDLLRKKLYAAILPTPALIIKLVAPADVLVERKPNELDKSLAIKKIDDENLIAEYYEARGAKCVLIDTSKQEIKECTKKIKDAIWSSDLFKNSLFE